jgi:hypothetical protein
MADNIMLGPRSLLIVFSLSSDIQGDRSKLKCLICDQVLEVDEENQSELVYDHFQSHPAELQKILWEKSQRKGFFLVLFTHRLSTSFLK